MIEPCRNSLKSNTELIRQYAEDGNQEAFAELVQRHIGWVAAAARRLTHGHHALADDISQAVFIVLGAQSQTACRDTVLANWLFVTTQFITRTAIRSPTGAQAPAGACRD